MVLFLVSAFVIGVLLKVVKMQRDEIVVLRLDMEIIENCNLDLMNGSQYLIQENKMLNSALMATPSRDIRTF